MIATVGLSKDHLKRFNGAGAQSPHSSPSAAFRIHPSVYFVPHPRLDHAAELFIAQHFFRELPVLLHAFDEHIHELLIKKGYLKVSMLLT